MPNNPRPKVPCQLIEDSILDPNGPAWKLDGKDVQFVQLLLAELGNIKHLDRLTIFKARPNRKKGNVCLLFPLYSSTCVRACMYVCAGVGG
jgi:chitinase